MKVKEKYIEDIKLNGYDAYYPRDILAQLATSGIDVSNFKDIESHTDPPAVRINYIVNTIT